MVSVTHDAGLVSVRLRRTLIDVSAKAHVAPISWTCAVVAVVVDTSAPVSHVYTPPVTCWFAARRTDFIVAKQEHAEQEHEHEHERVQE